MHCHHSSIIVTLLVNFHDFKVNAVPKTEKIIIEWALSI